MNVEIHPASKIAEVFPHMHNVKVGGISLAEGYYLQIHNIKHYSEEFLINSDIDLVLGSAGAFKQLSLQHNAFWDEDGDCYFLRKSDAKKAKEAVEQAISFNARPLYKSHKKYPLDL